MKKGFTIIELLVGVALIAVISVVALKFFEVAGGGAQHLGEREKRVINSQITSQYLIEEMSSAGLAGNYKYFFMPCRCDTAIIKNCSKADCGQDGGKDKFAVRKAEFTGYGVADNDVIFSSKDKNGAVCPLGKAFIYPKATPEKNITSVDIDGSAGTTTGTCKVTGAKKGDLFDVNAQYIQYFCDIENNRFAAEIINATSDPIAQASFPSKENTPNVVTLVDNVSACSIKFYKKGVSSLVDTYSSDYQEIIGAEISLKIKKSKDTAGTADGTYIPKTILIRRQINPSE